MSGDFNFVIKKNKDDIVRFRAIEVTETFLCKKEVLTEGYEFYAHTLFQPNVLFRVTRVNLSKYSAYALAVATDGTLTSHFKPLRLKSDGWYDTHMSGNADAINKVKFV